jgi:hypothetical protein
MVKIDDFLKTGKNHRVCEDYILSGNKPFPYIILSDGCSSSKNTEMGSKLLCYEARQLITTRTEDEIKIDKCVDTGSWVIHNAEVIARLLGLEKTSLDATLITAYKIGKAICISMYGDGIVLTQGKDDIITIFDINFSSNAPYYLSYTIDPKRDQEYYKMKNIQTITGTIIRPNGHFTISEDQRAYDHRETYSFLCSSYKAIMISSDGLKSFIKTTLAQQIILPDVVKELFSFKTTTGEFLKRRLGRMIQDYEKDNIFHYDDLSVGCFILEDEQ